MAISKPKLSRIVAQQLPEFIREDYPTFVAFLEAYYEYLESQNSNLYDIRDIDKTLDNFINYLAKGGATGIESFAGSCAFCSSAASLKAFLTSFINRLLAESVLILSKSAS